MVALLIFIILLLLGCQTYDATRQAASPVINATTEKIQPYTQEADTRVAGPEAAMKLCACRKGCRKEVKGQGLYALGHHPNSDQGRMPEILKKLREKGKVEGQQQGMEA